MAEPWRLEASALLALAVAGWAAAIEVRRRRKKAKYDLTQAKAKVYCASLAVSVEGFTGVAVSHQEAIITASLSQLHTYIADKEVSVSEVVTAFATQVQKKALSLRAISDERLQQALAEAHALDQSLASGKAIGPLFGVPFSCKDNISQADFCTSHGLARLCHHRLNSDSLIIKVLRNHGAIPLVRGTMAQLGASSHTENNLTGVCENPLRTGRSAGGSSGGDAALVSSRCVTFGLGGDIGGSLRIPASFTGVVSLRPTSSRISSAGPVAKGGWPGCSSTWGPIARSVEDLETVLETIVSQEVFDQDPLTPPIPWKRCKQKKLKIGFIVSDDFAPPCASSQRAVRECVHFLSSQGHELCEVRIPRLRTAFSTFIRYYLSSVGFLEPHFDHEKPLPTVQSALRSLSLPEVLRKVMALLYRKENPPLPNSPYSKVALPASEHAALQSDTLQYRDEFRTMWQSAGLDALIAPFPVPAGPHGHDYDESRAMVWTALFNLVDYPAGVVPVTTVRAEECTYTCESADEAARMRRILQGSEDLPISVQVAAPPFRDEVREKVIEVRQTLSAYRSSFSSYSEVDLQDLRALESQALDTTRKVQSRRAQLVRELGSALQKNEYFPDWCIGELFTLEKALQYNQIVQYEDSLQVVDTSSHTITLRHSVDQEGLSEEHREAIYHSIYHVCELLMQASKYLRVELPFALEYNRRNYLLEDRSGLKHAIDLRDMLSCEAALLYLYLDLRYLQQLQGVDLNKVKGLFDVKALLATESLGQWRHVVKDFTPPFELQLSSSVRTQELLIENRKLSEEWLDLGSDEEM